MPFLRTGYLLILILSLSTGFCMNTEQDSLVHPIGGRSFWALDLTGSGQSSYQVPTVFYGSTRNALAYVEVDSNVNYDKIETVLKTFEEKIAPVEHSYFGEPIDINNDEKVILLFLDIKDGASPGMPYIAGYFDPLNQYSDSSVYGIYQLRSNEQEMMYLDTYPADIESEDFLSTLAHEYQHLLHFSHDYDNAVFEERWVNEGLSELASDLTGFGPQLARLIYFENNSAPALIKDRDWQNELSEYSYVYVYFRFITDVYGWGVLTDIFRSSKTGIEGVEYGLQARQDSNLTSTAYCGSEIPAANPAFACSMRFMWNSVLYKDTSSKVVLSSEYNLNPNSVYDFNDTHRPSIPAAADLPTANEVSLGAYSARVYKKDASTNAGLTSCTDCDAGKFTLIYQNSAEKFVVFNHDAEATRKTKLVATSSQLTAPAPANGLVLTPISETQKCANRYLSREEIEALKKP